MQRKPRDPKARIIQWMDWMVILIQGLIMAGISLGVYFIALSSGGFQLNEQTAQTLSFITICVIQLNQSFFSRSLRKSVFQTGMVGNRWMLGAWTLSFGLLLACLFIARKSISMEIIPL